MPQNDTPRLSDIGSALRLLTRLPLPQDHSRPDPRAAWAWPLAGLLIGGIAAGIGMVALPLGAGIAAALVLAAQAMLTGAMHEDGLADTADGLWGGWDPARRLAIMKDSHIGTYGVMALLLVTLIRWSALSALLASGRWEAVIAVATLSRVPMTVLMAGMPNARASGLSHAVGRPSMRMAGLATVLGLAVAALAFGFGAIHIAFGVMAISAALALTARQKIGGQTGDILGASQQLAEATGLALAVTVIQ